MDLDNTLDHAASAPPWLPIEISLTADRRLARFDVAGELDGSTIEELLTAVRHVLAAPAPERVELHLAALTFIDSAGVRCLLVCRTAAEDAGSRLLLIDPAPQVIRILGMTCLLDLFGVPRHPGFDTDRRGDTGTRTGRAPHRAQPIQELFEDSARLRQTARETCARAEAARRFGSLSTLGPDVATD